jgi:hypothetical protein
METQAGPISDVGKRHSNSYTSPKKPAGAAASAHSATPGKPMLSASTGYWDQMLDNGIYVSTSIRGHWWGLTDFSMYPNVGGMSH